MSSPKPTRAKRPIWSTVAVLIAAIIFIFLVQWSYKGLDFDPTSLHNWGSHVGKFIKPMIPATRAEWLHDWDVVKSEKIAYFQTIQMDIFGTAVSVLIALPLSFFAARTTSFFRPLSVAIKSILNIGRAIPVLVYALIISVGVGLGPPAGAVAITFGTTMALAKLFAEALESISTGPIEAVKASGGNFIQIFVFGMLPQVFPNYISAALYAFEWNIGASAILGIVGAGGLGYDLQNFISFNQSAETGVIIAMLVLTVMLIDYISYRVRLIFA